MKMHQKAVFSRSKRYDSGADSCPQTMWRRKARRIRELPVVGGLPFAGGLVRRSVPRALHRQSAQHNSWRSPAAKRRRSGPKLRGAVLVIETTSALVESLQPTSIRHPPKEWCPSDHRSVAATVLVERAVPPACWHALRSAPGHVTGSDAYQVT